MLVLVYWDWVEKGKRAGLRTCLKLLIGVGEGLELGLVSCHFSVLGRRGGGDWS